MKSLLLILLAPIILFACTDEKNEEQADVYPNNAVVITSGYICGWCSDTDSLVITDDAFQYVAFNVCNSDEHIAEQKGVTARADWNALLQLLDFSDFKAIELNSCDIAFDGCDYWVQVRYHGKTHRIRYGSSGEDQSKLEPILPFLSKLAEIKESIKSAD